MKTKLILVSLLLSSSLIGFAQENSEKKKANFWFGPKAGLDLAHFTTNTAEIQAQLGNNYQVGVMAQLGKILYLQPEVYYATYKTSSSRTDPSSTNFIKIPVLAGLRLINLGIISAHVMAGPQFNLQLDNSSNISSRTLNWLGGVGVDLLGFITADIRYTLNPNQPLMVLQSLDTSGLNLTIGLKFR